MNAIIISYLEKLLLWAALVAICFYVYFLKVHEDFFKRNPKIRSLINLMSAKLHKGKTKKRLHSYRPPKPSLSKTVLSISALLVNVLLAYLILTHMLAFAAVMTESMSPTIDKGDLVLIQSLDKRVEMGDIIMFSTPYMPNPVMHRVYAITDMGYKTKGDLRNTPDPWTVTEEQIMGRAVTVMGKPIVIRDVGSYFIVGEEGVRIHPRYGSEYAFVKNMVNMVKSYGLVIFIVAMAYYILLIVRRE